MAEDQTLMHWMRIFRDVELRCALELRSGDKLYGRVCGLCGVLVNQLEVVHRQGCPLDDMDRFVRRQIGMAGLLAREPKREMD